MAELRDTGEMAAAVRRMVSALGRRVGHDDPEALRFLTELQSTVESALYAAVSGLREHGYTDSAIGGELGISRQAVRQRWPHLNARTGAGARYRTAQEKRGS